MSVTVVTPFDGTSAKVVEDPKPPPVIREFGSGVADAFAVQNSSEHGDNHDLSIDSLAVGHVDDPPPPSLAMSSATASGHFDLENDNDDPTDFHVTLGWHWMISASADLSDESAAASIHWALLLDGHRLFGQDRRVSVAGPGEDSDHDSSALNFDLTLTHGKHTVTLDPTSSGIAESPEPSGLILSGTGALALAAWARLRPRSRVKGGG